MSRYLVDQLATRSNVDVMLRTEVAAAHGVDSLEAIDVRNSATGAMSQLESGGLFTFIGADAETGWLPPEIALDHHGYVLTGFEMARQDTGRSTVTPTSWRRASPALSLAATSASAVKRVAAAVGEGSMAIAFVHQYLKELREAERGNDR